METRLLAGLLVVCACASGGCDRSAGDDVHVLADSAHTEGAIAANGSVIVDKLTQAQHGDFRTVNGGIFIGEGAHVAACTSVHGRIVVEAAARTGPIESVNGDLAIFRGATVQGSVSLVNGNVAIDSEVEVVGDVASVNGEIDIEGAAVFGDVVNYNGAVTVTAGAHVMGDLVIRDTVGANGARIPSVVIGPDAVVAGRLVFERPVRLYVHETARVSLDGVQAGNAVATTVSSAR